MAGFVPYHSDAWLLLSQLLRTILMGQLHAAMAVDHLGLLLVALLTALLIGTSGLLVTLES